MLLLAALKCDGFLLKIGITRGPCCSGGCVHYGLHALDDELHLSVVVIAVAGSSKIAGTGNALPGSLVWQIAADLFG